MRLSVVASPVLVCCSTLLATFAQAQAIPDAGALRQQIERERAAPSLPEESEPLRAEPLAPLSLPEGATIEVTSFRFVGNTLRTDDQLQAVVRGWLGRPLYFADLQSAMRAVANDFRRAGWLVSTHLPQQDVTDGIVTIQITESRFAGARIENQDATRLNPAIALRHVEAQQKTGDPLSGPALDRALLLVNDLSGVSASGALAPGDQHAQTLLMMRLNDDRWFDGGLRVDNNGARSTGETRALVSLNFNNPLRIGDAVRADILHSEGTDYARLGYNLPIGSDGWRLGLNASHFDYDLVASQFAALNGEGSSTSFGVDATYPIVRSRAHNLYLTFGLNERDFSNEALEVRQSDYSVSSWTMGLAGNLYDGLGGGGANQFSLVWVGGHLSHGSLNIGENPQVAGDFNKLLYSISRQQLLTSTFSLHAALSGQFSNEALDSSERMYLGGPDGVRAYPINDGGGSRSELLAVELRWLVRSWATAILFNDLGHVHNPGAEPDYTLKGYGVALEMSAPFGIQVEATYALRNGSNPNPGTDGAYQDGSRHRNHWWIGASMSF